MAIDSLSIETAVAGILSAIGEDPGRPGLVETPKRVAQAYSEFFAGVGVDPREHLAEATEIEDSERGELVLLRGLDFRSICEHHLLPFLGTAHVAYIPGDRLVGLGSLAKVVETLAARPQLQERLTEEIADALSEGLGAAGVLVVLDAVHGCVTTRGPRQLNSSTVTMASRGVLTEPARRAEVMALIGASS